MTNTPRAQSSTREALTAAADTLTFSRSNGVRAGSCDFLNSHRDGPCSRCLARDAHDAGLAANAAPAPLTDRRDQKALDLIHAGKVHLIPGQRFGLVDGSKGQCYTVSRDGCSCPDWTNRQVVGGCCHMRALRTVCRLYKAARAEARETGRTRLPWAVGLALRPMVKEEALAASVPAHVSDALGWCDRCGKDLPGGSRCPRGGHLDRASVIDEIVATVAA